MTSLDDLFQQAIEFSDNGKKEDAIRVYETILSRDSAYRNVHYNLGLIYKYWGDWEKSFDYNRRATELEPGSGAAHWNLGIAATALRRWRVARASWNHFGSKYESIEEDPAGNVGQASIRINPKGDAETVWATRICPARAVIKNIPFPESGHRYNDMVLNDGAPNGYRMSDGKEFPVFDELEHLSRSDHQTYSIKCELPNQQVYELLAARCKEAGIMIENWTTEVVFYCKQCSEGRPHEKHDHELAPQKESTRHTIAFATTSVDTLGVVLKSWSEETQVAYDDYVYYD